MPPHWCIIHLRCGSRCEPRSVSQTPVPGCSGMGCCSGWDGVVCRSDGGTRYPKDPHMKLLHKLFPLGHFLISLLFISCGLALILFAALQLWHGVQPWHGLALNERLH